MASLALVQWTAILFFFALVVGIIAPIGGVGGGVLFVPLATAFLPMNVDFIRGTGLIMAFTSSLASAPHLTERGLVNLRIVVPVGLVSIMASIGGGIAGLWLTNEVPHGEYYFDLFLGVLLLFIFSVMLLAKQVEYPARDRIDTLSTRLGLWGSWYEPTLKHRVEYQTTNLVYGVLSFAGVGFVAGMFGLGAGWASVPVLNLVMGAPIKIATATSMAVISINGAAASWVYIARGAVLPVLYVPSVLGVGIGARIGAKVAVRTRPLVIKYLVLAIMLFAALVDILKGARGVGIL
jgi:uncharacterized membrane protein YfcA